MKKSANNRFSRTRLLARFVQSLRSAQTAFMYALQQVER
jgi:hypothetical protein